MPIAHRVAGDDDRLRDGEWFDRALAVDVEPAAEEGFAGGDALLARLVDADFGSAWQAVGPARV